ncbi:hypothetical protein QTO01_15500 [Vibrio mytili]|uniref:hypothetical protein n=1 Tax=Vibrio mytili TaxID=50718 RepID=UPI00059AE9DA
MNHRTKVGSKKSTLTQRILNWISENATKPKALPILGGLSIGDFFIPALPTQTSVILLAWCQPKRAIWIILTFAIAATAGAGVLSLIAYSVDGYLIAGISPPDSDLYQHRLRLQNWLEQYGLWTLLVMSMLPTPPRLLIILSLLSGIAWLNIAATVFLGKLAWYSLVVMLVIKTPSFLMSLPWIGLKLQAILTR